MSEQKNKRLFLIDGYGFLFRAYHSLPPLTSPDGTPVGAVYGFTNMLIKLKNRIETSHAETDTHILLTLDSGKVSFRNDIYPDYKANRPEAPEDLKPQFPLIRDVAKALNIQIAEKEGFEADDLIAAYTKKAQNEGFKVTIISTDKDLMQLVIDGEVEMYDPMRERKITSKEVFEKFGVKPEKVLDVLSLMGDTSDNIPGVPGIGPKTASDLINKFGTLENLLNNIADIPQEKRRQTLFYNKENAVISKKLAALDFSAPTPTPLEELKFKKADDEVLRNFLISLGFRSTAAKIGLQSTPDVQQEPKQDNIISSAQHITVNSAYQLEAFINSLAPSPQTLNIFTLFENATAIKIVVNAGDKCAIINSAQQKAAQSAQNDLFSQPQTTHSIEYAYPVLQKLFNITSNRYVFDSAKDFISATKLKLGNNFDDLELINYLLHGTSKENNLRALAKSSMDIELDDLSDPLKHNDDNLNKYAAVQRELHKKLSQELSDSKLLNIYEHFEKPLIQVLTAMESEGIKVDANILKELSADFSSRLKILEKEIYKLADGNEFNIASPKQLGEVLFERIGIQGGKKSKSGQYITDSDVLETLAVQGYTIADKVLEYRALAKLINTYTEALQKEINPKTGRVHTKFNNISTTTGRLSSIDPNLQNIPIKSEDGRKIRKAFIAEKGNKLIGADYSQIELRLLAHVADIDVLKTAFKEGRDIHSTTAAQIFGVDISQVTKEQRNSAKTVNFGIIYGQSAFGLGKQLGISNTEARDIINKYFLQYPGIRAYMDNTIKFAREHGYVETIFKRKIYVHGINDKNGARRNFAERAAINAPLQGSASDIMKLAMVRIGNLEAQKNRNLENIDENHLSPCGRGLQIQQDLQGEGKNQTGLVNTPHPNLLPQGEKEKNNSESPSLQASKFPAKLLLQIHDELIFECPESAAEQAAAKCKQIMENVVYLSVPLIVEAKTGLNWGEVH